MSSPAKTYRRVPQTQYALMDPDEPNDPAKVGTKYTDLDRWRTPNLTPGVHSLLTSADNARARLRSAFAQSGLHIDDVKPGKRPQLASVDLDVTTALDLTTPKALRDRGLSVTYPDDCHLTAVRAACRAAGDREVSDGEPLLAVPMAEARVRGEIETIAVQGAAALTILQPEAHKAWFDRA